MESVRIVLDKKLLQAMDRAARRTNRSRSGLVRVALRDYLQRLEIRLEEERDRGGYAARPQVSDESSAWEAEVAWPEDSAHSRENR